MLFRRAPYVILALIAVSVLAFWPRYFSVLSAASWSLHFHAIVATTWMVLVGVQIWLVHNRRMPLHRTLGIGSLVLFPIFLASMVAVIFTMAQSTPKDDFYAVNGAGLGLFDAVSLFILAWLFYRALVTNNFMRATCWPSRCC